VLTAVVSGALVLAGLSAPAALIFGPATVATVVLIEALPSGCRVLAWRPRMSAAVRRYQAEDHQVWVAGALGAWPHRCGHGGALLRAAVMQASLLPPDVVVVG